MTSGVCARRDFILGHTERTGAALLPEVTLHLATEITPLWQASEAFLRAHNVAPPFWAFAWPGSQALARFITDRPETVAGRRVLDFAAGCGLAAIAAARAGAASAQAAEIDPLAVTAIALNAEANRCEVTVLEGDIVGTACRWDVILCGDVFYEAPMTRHILPWLRGCAARAQVIVADPGRAFVPQSGLRRLAEITVPTSLELEDSEARQVELFELEPGRAGVDRDGPRD